jgi:hypothetical protein
LHRKPAILAIGATQSKFELEVCQALDPVPHGLARSPKIFSIDGGGPPFLEALCLRTG